MKPLPTNGLRYLRRVAALLAAGGVLAAGLLFALRAELPDTFVLEQGQPLAVESMPFLQAAPAVPAGSAAPAGVTAADKSANVTLTLLGLPVKTVRTVQQQRRTVQLGGTPFGVKMFTDGALVVAFSDIYTVHGSENPAKEAGLRLGDLITQANGIPVRTNEELTDAIAAAAGGSVELRYLRGQNQMTCTLTPVRERGTDAPRAGIWVRDSSAGIGTLTFADTEHGTFAGLGHAVSDSDTGTDLTLLTGEAVSVTITGWRQCGQPGGAAGRIWRSAALWRHQSQYFDRCVRRFDKFRAGRGEHPRCQSSGSVPRRSRNRDHDIRPDGTALCRPH